MEMKNKIADMTKDMQFERRQPVPRAKKAAYDALRADINVIRKELNRLHLELWYASWHKDYNSLRQVRERIDDMAKRLQALAAQ